MSVSGITPGESLGSTPIWHLLLTSMNLYLPISGAVRCVAVIRSLTTGIVLLTVLLPGRRYGQARSTRRPQDCGVARGPLPQPASRAGERRALPGRRVLRRPGRGPGEVRDGAGRPGRRGAGDPGRGGVRLLPPDLLPGRGRAGRLRAGGAGRRQARPPRRPQAHQRGPGLGRAATRVRSRVETRRTGRADRAALRRARAPPLHRTSAGPLPGALQKMTCIGPRRGSLAAELAGWAPAPGRPPQLRRVTMNCVSIRVRGAGVPRELEEVPMPIVGGLDIHRKQITFDYLDTVTGEVRRGQITPADRAHLRAWLARFAGRDDVAFAMEGCTGWRYVAGELAAASIAAHVEGALRTEQDLAALRAAATAHLSPAGQLQLATAPDMLASVEARMDMLRQQLLHTARHLTGAKVLTARLYGVGPLAALAMTCWLGGAGRFSSSRKAVRFAGLDVTVYSSDGKRSPGHLSRQGPEILRWVVYEAGKTHARASAHDYYAAVKDRTDGKLAALSQARKILRQACHILTELGDDALTAA